jgi:hypothetical protein
MIDMYYIYTYVSGVRGLKPLPSILSFPTLKTNMTSGVLFFPALKVGFNAVSGGYGKGSLPNGNYLCKNFRARAEKEMVRDGIGFSVDLTPLFKTSRTDLRIHPDGGVPGTLGCIGIASNVAACRDILNDMLTRGSVRRLQVKPYSWEFLGCLNK